MNTEKAFRWAGMASIVAGILLIATLLVPSPLVLLALAPLALIAFVGIYARQIVKSGTLGLVGFLLIFSGLIVYISFAFFQALIAPSLIPETMGGIFGSLNGLFLATGVVQAVGMLAFGVASLQAGVFPSTAAILLIIGGMPNGFPPFIPPAIYSLTIAILGAAHIWFGYSLWFQKTN